MAAAVSEALPAGLSRGLPDIRHTPGIEQNDGEGN